MPEKSNFDVFAASVCATATVVYNWIKISNFLGLGVILVCKGAILPPLACTELGIRDPSEALELQAIQNQRQFFLRGVS